MAHNRKDPKPYTLKSRRGERPYSYSGEYAAWRMAVTDPRKNEQDVRAADRDWKRRYSPDPEIRAALSRRLAA